MISGKQIEFDECFDCRYKKWLVERKIAEQEKKKNKKGKR